MNLNDFYLSSKDKKNIQKWLETFDKPLFISGKTGIGKTTFANVILKDYTQILIDPHLTTNISEFIDKSINETDISMMFSKKKYKSIVFDNISYTDRIIIKELKNISLKKYKNPIVIIANNINNKQIQLILSNCLHINLQYTFEQFKSIIKSKYNSIDNSIIDEFILKSNFNFHMIDENIKYFKHNDYNDIVLQDIDSHEEDINILTKDLKNNYSQDEIFTKYSSDYNIISLNLLDDIYKSINSYNIDNLLKVYNSICIYDNYELFKSKYNLYLNSNFSIFYGIYYPYYILHNSTLKLSKKISYNSYISKSLIYTHIHNLDIYYCNDYEFYDLLIKLIYDIHKEKNKKLIVEIYHKYKCYRKIFTYYTKFTNLIYHKKINKSMIQEFNNLVK